MSCKRHLYIVFNSFTRYWQNALWRIHGYNPYKAITYDILHIKDLGQFGKYLFMWVLKELQETNQLEELDKR